MGEQMKSSDNKQVIFKHYVKGRDGAVLVKNLYLSCDPYMLRRMKNVECSYVGSFTPNSVDLLKNKFRFDDAFNYKQEQDYNAALKRYFPDRIDIYFKEGKITYVEDIAEGLKSTPSALIGLFSDRRLL